MFHGKQDHLFFCESRTLKDSVSEPMCVCVCVCMCVVCVCGCGCGWVWLCGCM